MLHIMKVLIVSEINYSKITRLSLHLFQRSEEIKSYLVSSIHSYVCSRYINYCSSRNQSCYYLYQQSNACHSLFFSVIAISVSIMAFGAMQLTCGSLMIHGLSMVSAHPKANLSGHLLLTIFLRCLHINFHSIMSVANNIQILNVGFYFFEVNHISIYPCTKVLSPLQ